MTRAWTWLAFCLALLVLTVWIVVDAVELGRSLWPRLFSVALWLWLTWGAWQAVRREGRGGPG